MTTPTDTIRSSPGLLFGRFSGWSAMLIRLAGLGLGGVILWGALLLAGGRSQHIFLPAYLCAVGAYLLLGEGSKYETRSMAVVFRGLGALLVAGWVAWAVLPLRSTPLSFETYADEALSAARASGQPVLLVVSAEWSPASKLLLSESFAHPQVRRAAERYQRFRLDITRESPAVDALKQRFEVLSAPTVLLFDTAGKERRDLRIAEGLPPAELLARLEQVE